MTETLSIQVAISEADKRDIAEMVAEKLLAAATPRKPESVSDYAARVCESESTVRRWCALGKINATRQGKIWRIHED